MNSQEVIRIHFNRDEGDGNQNSGTGGGQEPPVDSDPTTGG